MFKRHWKKITALILIVVLIIVFYHPTKTYAAFSYYRSITIDHTKVPNTDQSNFPVLVSGTYSYLATLANGGKVQNISGYDIGFYQNADCISDKLAWETETYTASTGAVNYWVKIPNVSHTADVTFYMCYGNPSITTDQSAATSVWDSSFKGVWHLPNGTSLTASDSTSNANNGTASNVTAASGQIDGGGSFNAATSEINVGSGASLDNLAAYTVSAWINVAGAGENNFGYIYSKTPNLSANGPRFFTNDSGGTRRLSFAAHSSGTAAQPLRTSNDNAYSASTITHVTATWDGGLAGTGIHIYVNGTEVTYSGVADGTTAISSDSSNTAYIGNRDGQERTFNGILDEIHVSNTVRSTDWIKTEYNNQNSPSTFYTVGSEVFIPHFSYVRAIVVDRTKVPNTNQTNFPVLVSGTYTYLKTTGNGGNVQNASGYDVGFYANSDCVNGKLAWETETYTASTGVVNYWVKIPTLSTSSDTAFYMCYGEPTITTDQSAATSVWDSNYKGVYHIPDGTTLASPSLDSTSNARNGTLTNTPVVATGQIDGGVRFNNGVTNQYINTTHSSGLSSNFTLSMWIKPEAFSGNPLASEVASYSNYYASLEIVNATNKIRVEMYDGTNNPFADSTTSLSTSVWQYIVMTRNTSDDKIYVYFNGVNEANATDTTTSTPTYSAFNIGKQVNVDRPYSGYLDEVRVSSVARSTDWITTEYNNQSSPSTFYTIGSQTTPTTPNQHKIIFAANHKFVFLGNSATTTGAEGTGGTITYSGGYTIHTFTSSGTFVAPIGGAGTSVEYLVVAGGGGGGPNDDRTGGGGGAGGLLTDTVVKSSGESTTVTIGAGGTGSVGGGAATSGGNSVFGSVTATGGGKGGKNKSTGGSGGGGYHAEAGAAGTAGQGSAGGNGYDSGNGNLNFGGGGGGGASAVGANAQSSTSGQAGDGGAGTTSSISGSSVTYAGGGGGGAQANAGAPNYAAGAGGAGGGGAGGKNANGTSGTANTGGGGGGAGNNNTSGNGGSGIVIVRYLTPYVYAGSKFILQ
ncbi:MAG TPA: LamG domain-containing protein [Candidatus Paceibacterota bacterium]